MAIRLLIPDDDAWAGSPSYVPHLLEETEAAEPGWAAKAAAGAVRIGLVSTREVSQPGMTGEVPR
jgi:hypothetical protein